MRFERINENQIRCTLSSSDLAERELRLSELAYGTAKAKELFKDMMAQASDELGFEAEHTPIIIEAIPLSGESIMLIITKVEDPEELDTRFSKFSPCDEDDEENVEDQAAADNSDILDIFRNLRDELIAKDSPAARQLQEILESCDESHGEADEAQAETQVKAPKTVYRIYVFENLEAIEQLSVMMPEALKLNNKLYKNPKNEKYYLVLSSVDIPASDFSACCDLISEYSRPEKASINTLYYYEEHYDCIIKSNALQILRTI